VGASLDAIIVADSNGCVEDYNAAAELIFGWARNEILGCNLTETLLPKRDRAEFKAQIDANHNSPFDTGRFEATGLRKGGEEFPIELNLASVKDTDRVNYVAYVRDISDRKNAEQTLMQSLDRAKQANDAKSRFLAVMSHEMRTPLNGILGVLDLLRAAKDRRTQKRYIDIATASSEVLLQHVNEALDITRIETGETVIASHPFNLRDLCTGVVEVLEPLAHEKGISLHLTYAANAPHSYEGDASRVRQIITNLIGNAIKFTERGEVEVRVVDTSLRQADAEGGTSPSFRMSDVRIDVMDTGRGIAPENLERIFEDFVSIETALGRQLRNDGLGLSISRRFARLMGGNLIVHSTQGLGSTFTLLLKLRALDTKTANKGDKADSVVPLIAFTHPVLIVEDNDVNRSVLRDMLKGFGLEMHEAQNGAIAVEMAQRTQFDLILMDVSMPVMNGIDATRALRGAHGPNQHTRIIGLTAHGVDALRDAATTAGMDAIFAKPIRLSTLRQIMFTHSTNVTPVVKATHLPDATDIDIDYLQELVSVLGPIQANSVAGQFFTELEAALTAPLPPAPPTSWDDIAEAVHKIHGAAALLGLIDMAQELQHSHALAADEDPEAFAAHALKTLKYGEGLQSRLAEKITYLTPEHGPD
jgi:PAS domain S-box-containing protein